MSEGKFEKSCFSEDGTLKFYFMTSLQNIVMAKIASNMWMDKSNLQDIVNFIHSGIRPQLRVSSDSWQQVINNILNKVSELPLPKVFLEKLRNIVPVLGNSVLNWIKYHECILNCTDYSAVDQIKMISWTARGKIDYAQTAKNILADKDSCLSDDHKYKLACVNCLKEEIEALAPNVVNQYYLDSVQIHMHPMVYFWTAYITNDNTKFHNHYRDHNRPNISINYYVINLLIDSNKKSYRSFNDVPIRYMWDTLSAEEQNRYIVSLVKKLGNQELIYTLISNLNFEKQQEIFKKYSETILFYTVNDWLWEEHFLPIALYILDIMQPSAYFFILKHVTDEISINFEQENELVCNKYSYIFKQLLKKGYKIFENETQYCLIEFVFSFPLGREMDAIDLIFNDINAEQKKSILFDGRGIERCANLIKDGRWDLLELFIRSIISSEEDISQLKKKILNDWWLNISEHFLRRGALDKIENFLSWISQSEEEINGLRKSLAKSKYKSAYGSVISSNKIDFTNLENYFKWCAKGDLDVINQCKSEMLISYSEELIRKLITTDKYELLDEFLDWCCLNNQSKIAEFKSNMYKGDNVKIYIQSIILSLIEKDKSMKGVDKYFDWLFTNQQEVQEFKMWMLHSRKEMYYICKYLITSSCFELADEFIEWCLTPEGDINTFRKQFLFSDHFLGILQYYSCSDCNRPLFIRWIYPFIELSEKYKHISPGFYKLFQDFLKKNHDL